METLMTPRTKGAKSERKNLWTFYFNLNLKRTNLKKAKESLTQYNFRKFKEFQGVYDLEASISLELDYNASKFAKDLMRKFKFIQEIEVREKPRRTQQ